MRKYLSVAGVGRRLQLTSAAVRSIADRGTLRIAAKTESGTRLFNPADVERLARARQGTRERRSRKAARAA
jgi:DNA-binding transcriptional MerR regulator